jgi:tetratricopeptide (TPR) repeat protein
VADSGERNMLFDIRGRRKRVIQVVYAALALLMALSLFTVVGPVSLGDIGLGGGSSTDQGSIYDDQIERLEAKLRKNPDDQAALVQLTRARFNAGSAQLERDPATNAITGISEEAVTDFNEAGEAWERYLKTDPQKPNAIAAQLAAQSLLYAASTSTAVAFEDKIQAAAEAQEVYAEASPSLSSYLTLAQYRFYAGDNAGAEEAGRRAEQEAPKAQRPAVTQTLVQYRKQGKQVQKQVKAASKFQPGAGGEEALQNPLGGLSGGGSGTGAP